MKLIAVTAAELTAHHLKSDKELGGFKMDRTHLTLPWGGYDYEIELRRIDTPETALAFIAHISEKRWEGMTAEKIGCLVRALCTRFGWNRNW